MQSLHVKKKIKLGDVNWHCSDILIFHWRGDYILNFDEVFTQLVPVNFRGLFKTVADIYDRRFREIGAVKYFPKKLYHIDLIGS